MVRHALEVMGKRRDLVETKSRESRRTLTLPSVVLRTLERHKVNQPERRLAVGSEWLQSDYLAPLVRADEPRTLLLRLDGYSSGA